MEIIIQFLTPVKPMTSQTYFEPVSQLLHLGLPEVHQWPDYLAMGLTSADIPELIRLVQDEDLRWMEAPEGVEDLPEWYAQIHAWRTLAQLKAEGAIPALLGILHQVDDYDDDWTSEELEDVFAMIGPAGIPSLADYLANTENKPYARGAAAGALTGIAKGYPETRNECVAAQAKALELFEQNDESINAFIICELVDLKAVEHIELMEKAFKAEKVEEIVCGDFEDIQIELGLLAERITPPQYGSFHRQAELIPKRESRCLQKSQAGESQAEAGKALAEEEPQEEKEVSRMGHPGDRDSRGHPRGSFAWVEGNLRYCDLIDRRNEAFTRSAAPRPG